MYLLSEGSGGGDLKGLKKAVAGQTAGLEDEHAGVEVERGRAAHVGGPRHPVRALLAVPDGVLPRVAPRLLAEAVHDGVEVAVRVIEQVVDVLEHLDVRV